MRNFKYIIIFLIACFAVSSQSVAQEIQIGMPLSKLLPILADQKCHVDTTREGRIKSFITRLEASPFKMFTVGGRARFCIEPGVDTLYGWEWIADSMSLTDYRLIVQEVSKTLRDTGYETDARQIDLSSRQAIADHEWGDEVDDRRTVSFLSSNQVWFNQGYFCSPIAPETAAPPPLADTANAPPTLSVLSQGIGKSRAFFIDELPEVNFIQGNDIRGEENYTGALGTAIIQLIGPAEDLKEASVTLGVDSSYTQLSVLSGSLLGTFAETIVDGGAAWFAKSISTAWKNTVTRSFGNIIGKIVVVDLGNGTAIVSVSFSRS